MTTIEAPDVLAAFREASAFVLAPQLEGGYVNNPADRGGPTNHGITLDTLRGEGAEGDLNHDGLIDAADVKLISLELATRILKRGYWDAGVCFPVWSLSRRVGLIHFDGCVNHGVGLAPRLLQRTVGAQPVDGDIGPGTLASLKARLREKSDTAVAVDLLVRRWGRYKALAFSDPRQRTFLAGWRNRLIRLRTHLQMPTQPWEGDLA